MLTGSIMNVYCIIALVASIGLVYGLKNDIHLIRGRSRNPGMGCLGGQVPPTPPTLPPFIYGLPDLKRRDNMTSDIDVWNASISASCM